MSSQELAENVNYRIEVEGVESPAAGCLLCKIVVGSFVFCEDVPETPHSAIKASVLPARSMWVKKKPVKSSVELNSKCGIIMVALSLCTCDTINRNSLSVVLRILEYLSLLTL